MRLFFFLVFALSMFLFLPVGRGQGEGDLKRRVERLQVDLDDVSSQTRIEAEHALIELGPKVLDFLKPITADTSSEVASRLKRIRTKLENEVARVAADGTTVTLKGTMSLSDALAKIQEQTGNRFAGHERYETVVKVEFDKTPFWEAVDHVLDQAKLTINPYGGAGLLALQARPAERSPRSEMASYAGIFRIQPLWIDAVRDLQNPNVNGLRMKIEVNWEPRLTPIALLHPRDQITAIDENGKFLKLDNAQGQVGANVQPEICQVQMVIPMALPDRGVKKISSLKGKLLATLPGRYESFEFPDLSKIDQSIVKAGTSVTMQKFVELNDLHAAHLVIKFDDAANALESHRGWIYRNPVLLVDGEGNEVESQGYETTRQTENEIGFMYLFDAIVDPSKYHLVYKTPGAIVQIPFDYELKDIWLP